MIGDVTELTKKSKETYTSNLETRRHKIVAVRECTQLDGEVPPQAVAQTADARSSHSDTKASGVVRTEDEQDHRLSAGPITCENTSTRQV